MTDKDFWLIVRRALLMVVRAIEQRYEVNKKIFLGDDDENSV
jgi:hypothetical protein